MCPDIPKTSTTIADSSGSGADFYEMHSLMKNNLGCVYG